MMDIAQAAAAAGTFIGAMVGAFFARKAKSSTEKLRAEVEGPGNEPSLRQMLLSQNRVIEGHAATVATEFARTHRDSGAIMERVSRLEGRVDKLEKVHRNG